MSITDNQAAEMLRHLSSSTPPSKAKASEWCRRLLEEREVLLA
jgi:hypothetical protein